LLDWVFRAARVGASLSLMASLMSAPQAWAQVTFAGRVVGVSDGDTVNVLTEQACDDKKDCRSGKRQYRVRLAEIDAPETGQPFGASSKRMLSNLVFNKQVSVQRVDIDRYGRVVGQIYLQKRWINAEMVENGGAWVYRQYSKTPKLLKLEEKARSRKQGLWALQADQVVPPWQWRKEKKASQSR